MSAFESIADMLSKTKHVADVPIADLRSRGDNLPLAAWCALD